MARPSVTEVTIGDNVFYVRKYDPFLGLEILGDLQKHFLGPVTRALEARGAASTGEAMQAVFQGIDKLSSTLDGKTLAALAKMVLNADFVAVAINGGEAQKLSPHVVPAAFSDVGEIAELVMEVVKINYEGFIRRSLARIGPGLTAAQPMGSASSAMN